MKKRVEYLQNYMNTYNKQMSYLDYRDETFIHDILYGLGVALDPEKHTWHGGYQKFKRFLREFLDKHP